MLEFYPTKVMNTSMSSSRKEVISKKENLMMNLSFLKLQKYELLQLENKVKQQVKEHLSKK
jgi:hypothetical protein